MYADAKVFPKSKNTLLKPFFMFSLAPPGNHLMKKDYLLMALVTYVTYLRLKPIYVFIAQFEVRPKVDPIGYFSGRCLLR